MLNVTSNTLDLERVSYYNKKRKEHLFYRDLKRRRAMENGPNYAMAEVFCYSRKASG